MATLAFTIKVAAKPPAAPTGLTATPIGNVTKPSPPTALKATPR